MVLHILTDFILQLSQQKSVQLYSNCTLFGAVITHIIAERLSRDVARILFAVKEDSNDTQFVKIGPLVLELRIKFEVHPQKFSNATTC